MLPDATSAIPIRHPQAQSHHSFILLLVVNFPHPNVRL